LYSNLERTPYAQEGIKFEQKECVCTI